MILILSVLQGCYSYCGDLFAPGDGVFSPIENPEIEAESGLMTVIKTEIVDEKLYVYFSDSTGQEYIASYEQVGFANDLSEAPIE